MDIKFLLRKEVRIKMKIKQMMIFTIAFFVLFMLLVPAFSLATQVTPTYRWSPARPEKVIEQFFAAQCAKDFHTVKYLMAKNCKDFTLPGGSHVSLVGWDDYNKSELYINSVKLISITKLDNFCDPDQRLECYEVLGDFKFTSWAPYTNGPQVFFMYLQRDEKDVWKIYAPECVKDGPHVFLHKTVDNGLWSD
jgi:hypothetical protein